MLVITSGSCHFVRVSNIKIGVEFQIIGIVIFFKCSWVLQFGGAFKESVQITWTGHKLQPFGFFCCSDTQQHRRNCFLLHICQPIIIQHGSQLSIVLLSWAETLEGNQTVSTWDWQPTLLLIWSIVWVLVVINVYPPISKFLSNLPKNFDSILAYKTID